MLATLEPHCDATGAWVIPRYRNDGRPMRALVLVRAEEATALTAVEARRLAGNRLEDWMTLAAREADSGGSAESDGPRQVEALVEYAVDHEFTPEVLAALTDEQRAAFGVAVGAGRPTDLAWQRMLRAVRAADRPDPPADAIVCPHCGEWDNTRFVAEHPRRDIAWYECADCGLGWEA